MPVNKPAAWDQATPPGKKPPARAEEALPPSLESLFKDLDEQAEAWQTPDPQVIPEEPPVPSPSPPGLAKLDQIPVERKDGHTAEHLGQLGEPGDGKPTDSLYPSAPEEKALPQVGDKYSSESFSGHIIAQPSSSSQPARLSLARPLTKTALDQASTDTASISTPALLLEVVDETPGRLWSEDELLLVEQVSDQLTLALENAQLFQQSRKRAEQLAILNEMSGKLSEQLDVQQVCDTAYFYTASLMQSSIFYIALNIPKSSESEGEIYFPIYVEEQGRRTPYRRPYQNGLTEYIFRTGQPLLIRHDVGQYVTQVLGANLVGQMAQSWLGVPMLYADQVIGVMAVQSYSTPDLYSEEDRDMLTAIANQVAVALQNARLFEQTQTALGALEISERYQKAVALATSILTERGIASLSDILSSLGQAAGASRAYYFETQVDPRGSYWRLISEWHTSEVPAQINNPALRRLSTRFLADWLRRLRQQGHIAVNIAELPDEYGQFFEQFGTRSILQLAVPGRHEIPGCIGFEQIDATRQWSADEISALQTAAAALANTIAREDLFTQVQINLAETEALYQASARLNSAADYQAILGVLRQHTILGHTNSINVSIHLFDVPWTSAQKPEWLIPIARWSGSSSPNRPRWGVEPSQEAEDSVTDSFPSGLSSTTRYSISEWSTVEMLLQPDRPTAITDIASDPRIDEIGRSIYIDRMQAKSLLYTPLNVAGRWIGHMIAIYRQTTGFPEHELRRLMSLAGQAAVAVQNLRLLDEASRRARQLQTAAEVARDVTGALSIDALLKRSVELLSERFEYYHTSIFLIDESSQMAVIAESTGAAGEELKRNRHSLAIGSRSVIGQALKAGQAIVLNDLSDPQNAAVHKPNPLLPLTQAELGIPLKIGSRVIGALDVQSELANAFSPDDVTVLQILADQLAVTIENARAYELAQKAAEELRQADRLKSQFLANMSHELRTPLNSIIGFSRVILKGIDGPINELQQQDLSAIYNSGQHLLGLINDVLDLSKIEAGKMELAIEEHVDLSELIHGVLTTTSGLVKDKPIELRQQIDPDLPLLSIDAMKIRQVMINLLSNAAKFTEQGSITVQAGIEEVLDGTQKVIVRVIDTGPGISEEDQKKLFQPFSQVDGSLTRKTGGSGLGLSISQHFIHMHGGEIGLQSEVGKGTTFYFTLPAPTVSEQIEPAGSETFDPTVSGERTAESTNQPGVEAFAQPDSKLIIAIDKDPQVIDVYRRWLAGENFTILALNELEQATTVARGLQPAIITLDIAMQEKGPTPNSQIDGWRILKELKKEPATQKIPVIICSLLEEQEKAFEQGADGYLLKPVLQDDLLEAFHRLLNRDEHD
jgi:signal transduction histidine kinase/ActR/RegA family two-component response regulator